MQKQPIHLLRHYLAGNALKFLRPENHSHWIPRRPLKYCSYYNIIVYTRVLCHVIIYHYKLLVS